MVEAIVVLMESVSIPVRHYHLNGEEGKELVHVEHFGQSFLPLSAVRLPGSRAVTTWRRS